MKTIRRISSIFSDKGLTRKATLNALASALDFTSRMLVGFLLQPLMVSGLGDYFYGLWQMLLRLMGYLSPASGRATQALKMTLANQQSSEDFEKKRHYVGSALAVWMMFLPLVATLGGLLTWYLPILIKSPEGNYWIIRLVSSVLVVNLVITNLVALPQSVLEGENLGYKRIGLSVILVFLGGGLTWLALIFKTGLIGVGISILATTILSGLFYIWVARSFVPWFGVAKPRLKEALEFLQLSWWFIAWNLVMNLMTASDVIILGFMVSVETITDYSLSKYLPETLINIVAIMVFGVAPGLGGIIGKRDYAKAARVRGEIMTMTWLMITILGSLMILWNRTFIGLWISPEHFVGALPNLLMVLIVGQFILIRNDANIIDLSLRLERKVILGSISVGISLALAIVFTGVFRLGITGLCLGLIAGRILLSAAYPIQVGKLLGLSIHSQLQKIFRPGAVSLIFFLLAIYCDRFYLEQQRISIDNWFSLIVGIAISSIALFLLAFYLGLNSRQRLNLSQRARMLLTNTNSK